MRILGILIRKDVRLVMMPVLFYMLVGAVAIGMMGVERHAFFYAASVLLITAMIALGFHPAMATVVGERKEQTLAFVMSMPITPTDYTWTKVLANLLLFFVPFLLLLGGTLGMISVRPSMPDGLIPYAVILFGYLAATAVLILCVALVTESMQWTIVVQIAGNLGLQGVMYGASTIPAIKSTINTEMIVWSEPALLFIGSEIAISLILLAATLWLQSRKTDFI
ncbi:hypothetical protein C7C56_002490 [Massilia glaciei]|uniref:ABC-2 type transporter transmembrane domain-containing protein n=2 Tax=Massilia glaciei TaxID=1524097 RepID=A0A2U2I6J8_9BURK|nr:hypothetical protein C7C56_002490 [Massilia glaciei]